MTTTPDSPTEQTRVRVKPLQWKPTNNGYVSGTALGRYAALQVDRGVWGCYLDGSPIGGVQPTDEKAKAAAQRDYEARVLSCLSSAPAEASEPVTFTYLNWRGEVADRRVTGPFVLQRKTSDWHGVNRLLLSAFDLDKKAMRDFAVDDILPDAETSEPTPASGEAEPGEAPEDVIDAVEAVIIGALSTHVQAYEEIWCFDMENAPRCAWIWVYCPAAHGLSEIVTLCRWDEDAGFCVDELRSPTAWTTIRRPPPPIPAKREEG